MTVRSHFRGHPTIWAEEGFWVYADTRERAGFEGEIRPCKKCNELFEGSNIGKPDPCLGNLPGVDNACCGHGFQERAYVRFTNGVVLTGFTVEEKMMNNKPFAVGDLVEVIDPGLAALREILPGSKPNHHGVVSRVLDCGTIMVEFPIGEDSMDQHSQISPYPASAVRARVE